MAALNFELKHYQSAALERYEEFLKECAKIGVTQAYEGLTGGDYREVPAIADGTPYVCLRIPTGGGKTIMAAHSIGISAKHYLLVPNPMVLWLTPTNTILEQTITALKDVNHPYRVALEKQFGQNVSVLSKQEALTMTRPDAEGGACVIVTTLQSFRRTKADGEVDPEGLKVYQRSGQLMEHFSGLTDDQISSLELVEGTGKPVSSLANLLRLHRPMVIVDEAHNARTDLSFDTLAAFNPSLILELTATPELEHDTDKNKIASNILYSVSAAELKAESMIKMPIKLTTDPNWEVTVGAALDLQEALEKEAMLERAQTGEYIRPIILFQAQNKNQEDDTRITFDKLKAYLTNDKGIAEEQIAIQTGGIKDLDGIEITDEKCPIKYVITVQQLKEGWDCPFAYVLCSVAEQTSPTAVEQIMGRVLRMPKVKLKQREALNEAYAFVASPNFSETANKLRDGLVKRAGYDPVDVSKMVQQQKDLTITGGGDAEYISDQIDVSDDESEVIEKRIEDLPPSVKSRLKYEAGDKKLRYVGSMTKQTRTLLNMAFSGISAIDEAVDSLFAKSNNYTPEMTEEIKPPFRIPFLSFEKQGKLELFNRAHFLHLPWPLHKEDPTLIVKDFQITPSDSGKIDIGKAGKVEIEFVSKIHEQLVLVVHEASWTKVRLIAWLDKQISHKDVTKSSATSFVSNAIDALIADGKTLDELVRHKTLLRNKLADLIDGLRSQREQNSFKALFEAEADKFKTSSELSLVLDEQQYSYNQPYKGSYAFEKHYFPIIGDLKSTGEEHECAMYIDRISEVKYWIRNVERKPNAFWLQLPEGKFYPDFLVELEDGRMLAVEYKGGHLYNDAEEKRLIGKLWAERSEGECLFCMPTERNFSVIDDVISASSPLPKK